MDLESIFDDSEMHMEGQGEMQQGAADLAADFQRDVLGYTIQPTQPAMTAAGLQQPSGTVQQVHPSMHYPGTGQVANSPRPVGLNGAGAAPVPEQHYQQFVTRPGMPGQPQQIVWQNQPRQGQVSGQDHMVQSSGPSPRPIPTDPAQAKPSEGSSASGRTDANMRKPISLQKIFQHMYQFARSDKEREQFQVLYSQLKQNGDKTRFISGLQKIVGKQNLLAQINQYLKPDEQLRQQQGRSPAGQPSSSGSQAQVQGLQPGMAQPHAQPGAHQQVGFNQQGELVATHPAQATAPGTLLPHQVPQAANAMNATKSQNKAPAKKPPTMKQKAAALKAADAGGQMQAGQYQMAAGLTAQQQAQYSIQQQMAQMPHQQQMPGQPQVQQGMYSMQAAMGAGGQQPGMQPHAHLSSLTNGMPGGAQPANNPVPAELRNALAMPVADTKPGLQGTPPPLAPGGSQGTLPTTGGMPADHKPQGTPGATPGGEDAKPKPKAKPRPRKPPASQEPMLDAEGNPMLDADGNPMYKPKPPSKAALARQRKKEREEAAAAAAAAKAAEAAAGANGAGTSGAAVGGAAAASAGVLAATPGGPAAGAAAPTGASPAAKAAGDKAAGAGANVGAGGATAPKESQGEMRVEDMADVTKISGIDLISEQNALLAGPDIAPEAALAARHEPEWALCANLPLRWHVEKVRKGHGVGKVAPEVLQLLEAAVQARLRQVAHALIHASQHRVDAMKARRPTVRGRTWEVRRGVRLIQKAEKEAEDERAAAERARLLKQAETMKRAREPAKDTPENQMRQKMAKVQQEEQNRIQTSVANVTAMGALGLGGDDKWAKWAAMAQKKTPTAAEIAAEEEEKEAEAAAAAAGETAAQGGAGGEGLTIEKERVISLQDCMTVLQSDVHTSKDFLAKLQGRISHGKKIT